MSSATDIDLVDQKPAAINPKKRSAYNSSLILGIALIVTFLGLFVIEFTRILTLTGRVNHAVPNQLHELAEHHYHSS